MFKRLLIQLISFLERFTYEPLTVDNANQKLIVPVAGLILNGKQLYRYKNDLDIPIKRRTAISAAYKWFGATLQVKDIVEFINQILEANNTGDKSRVGMLGFSLVDMLKNCTDEEALHRMAAAMYFFKDEDHSQFDSDIAAEKVTAFKKLKGEKRDFFLRSLFKHMGVSSATSLNDIMSNLKKSKAKVQAYKQLLSEGSSQET
ncbi:MAG: hypothetical protein ABJG41_10045 [Cyclobacteriaceae bacterium]